MFWGSGCCSYFFFVAGSDVFRYFPHEQAVRDGRKPVEALQLAEGHLVSRHMVQGILEKTWKTCWPADSIHFKHLKDMLAKELYNSRTTAVFFFIVLTSFLHLFSCFFYFSVFCRTVRVWWISICFLEGSQQVPPVTVRPDNLKLEIWGFKAKFGGDL